MRGLLLLAAMGASCFCNSLAQTPEYVRSEVMIPVRDGVKLHAVIFRPKGSENGRGHCRFLMERTPYGVDEYQAEVIPKIKPELAKSGYIFVYEDIRGRYKSEGQFVMNRPVIAHTAKTDVDETTDTRDTIDWLLKNVPNNDGKVGVLGISYPGFLAMMAGDRCASGGEGNLAAGSDDGCVDG